MKRATPPILDFVFVLSIALRIAAADGQSDNAGPKTNEPVSYAWSETTDYARVPKNFLSQITIRPITMTNFETQVHVLTDEFVGIFKLTPSEVERVNASLAEALHEYRLEESRHLVPRGEVITNAAPLPRLGPPVPAIERFTFQYVPFPEEARAIRKKLEASVLKTLGEERAKFFWQSGLMLESAMNTFSRPEMFRPMAFTYQLTDHAKLGLLVDLYQTGGGGGHGITYTAPLDQYAPEALKPVLARWRKAIAERTAKNTAATETPRAAESNERVSLNRPQPTKVETGAPWTDKSPFVDLPKSLIKSLQIAGFAPEGDISPEAVTLFGLNSEEEKAVRALYDQMKLRFEQIERAHFSRVEPGKNSFVVRAFPEKSAALRQEWAEKLQHLVGKGRGELLDQSIRTPVSPFNEMRRARARDVRAHLRLLHDRGADWMHRGTAEIQLDVSLGNPGRDGQPTYRIEYRTEGEGGGGSWDGPADQIPERWRHLLTPDILGVSLNL